VNREDVIRMAKEAGGDDWGIFRDFMPEIERFAALVASAERDECVKLCKWLADRYPESDASSCVDIISLRGKE
jgi:hypothetical protein